MKRSIALITFGLMTCPIMVAAQTLATVDGKPITLKEVTQVNPDATQNVHARDTTLNALINRQILLNKADKEGLPQSPVFQKALTTTRENLLIQMALLHYTKRHPITTKAIATEYHHLIKTAPSQQYRLREILASSYDNATSTLQMLKAGQSFSKLAAQSNGPNAVLGGELGWVNDTQIAAPILSKIRSVQPGIIIGPINLSNGWAIIQVMSERKPPILPLSAMKSALQKQLEIKQRTQYILQLRKAAKIHITAATKSS
jgi:peptidyl-prolyl cis-trans isomerase C